MRIELAASIHLTNSWSSEMLGCFRSLELAEKTVLRRSRICPNFALEEMKSHRVLSRSPRVLNSSIA